jgi:hypothetical protein
LLHKVVEPIQLPDNQPHSLCDKHCAAGFLTPCILTFCFAAVFLLEPTQLPCNPPCSYVTSTALLLIMPLPVVLLQARQRRGELRRPPCRLTSARRHCSCHRRGAQQLAHCLILCRAACLSWPWAAAGLLLTSAGRLRGRLSSRCAAGWGAAARLCRMVL